MKHALTLHRGTPTHRLTLSACFHECERLDDLEITVLRELQSTPRGGIDDELHRRWWLVREQRMAAERRLRRAMCEADGVRWLGVVEVENGRDWRASHE